MSLGEGGAPVEDARTDDKQDDDGDDDELAAGLLRRASSVLPVSVRLICTVPLIWAVWVSRCSVCSGKLLSSEIIFVVGLGDAYGTGQRELGDIVLVERADVLVVGLLDLDWACETGRLSADTGVEALLCFTESLVGEIDVGVGRRRRACRGLMSSMLSRIS